MTKTFNVAIVGATGVVGGAMLSILEERNFPVAALHLLASQRSAGETREFKNQSLRVTDVAHFDFSKTEICLFSAGNDISAKYAPIAASAGNIVIDNSSQFRYERDIPLVVPEVNLASLESYKNRNIIANPNCVAMQIVVALKPIYDAVGITRVNISTYQSVSGTGKDAMNELAEQTAHLLNGRPIQHHVYPQQIAFNVLPHIDEFEANGYTREEMKIILELKKILGDENLGVNPTAVRVPVFCGHSASLHIETKKKITAAEATRILQKAPGVEIITGKYPYPTPVTNGAGKDPVFVGRIREDLSHKHGLDLWVVADNLRKGAALNAVQIAECLVGFRPLLHKENAHTV